MDWETGELLRIDIRRAMGCVDQRAQDVLVAVFGLDGQPSCIERELAGEYGLSTTRINQIKARALRRMRKKMLPWWSGAGQS